MIKKSLIVASLLLTGTSAVAQNYFVGVDYLNLDTTATFTLTDADGQYSESDSEKDKNFNFKIGMDNIANGRVYLKTGNIHDYSEDGFGIKYESTSINYDYYIGKYNKFTPYIGAGIGQGKLSWDYDGIGASGSGLEYGMRIGALVEISKNTNVEFGYTVLTASAEAKLASPDNSASINIEADDAKGLFVGFNYKF